MGFEPTTCSLRMSCSTTELKRLNLITKLSKFSLFRKRDSISMVNLSPNLNTLLCYQVITKFMLFVVRFLYGDPCPAVGKP